MDVRHHRLVRARRGAAALGGAIAMGSAILGASAAEAAPAACEIDRPVVFAGLDYDSAAFHTALARTIIEDGYGCETDSIPGTTLVLAQGLGRGDVDVMMEIWTANPAQAFVDAETAGKAVRLGATFPDAEEGWYVPRYVVEGEDAAAPELKSVADLPQYKALFEDPEEPGKGRFYNCVIGWQCELVNTKKLAAYGLDDDYTNVRPGAGAALDAAVESAILRERPVLFYHWSPTALIGRYDFVKLEEPPFDQAVWDAMLAAEDPEQATAYPTTKVVVGANAAFAEEAPELRAFLERYGMTSALTSDALAYMASEEASPEEAAERFLREHPEVWKAWVPEEVAARVEESIGG